MVTINHIQYKTPSWAVRIAALHLGSEQLLITRAKRRQKLVLENPPSFKANRAERNLPRSGFPPDDVHQRKGGTVGIGMRDDACGVGAAALGARGIALGDCGSDDSAIAATIVTIGSTGMHAIASPTFFIPRVIHDAAIETTHATGNVTKPKTIAHTSGFESDPGASNAIGAPTAAIRKPGTARTPQITDTAIARIGRGLRLSGTIALL